MTLERAQVVRTSEKRSLPWRDTRLTFIGLLASGTILPAYTLADKRELLEAIREGDRLLAVRQVQYPPRQEVMLVDDLDQARVGLSE